ncbi:MAG: hypothetical protein ACJ8FT_07640 [Sphingomonas sp.]
MKLARRALLVSAAALGVAGIASAAFAQAQETPKNWSYTIDKNGQRVPKSTRVTKADGSWREEVRQGNCVTVKERSATGEYRETQQCNPR